MEDLRKNEEITQEEQAEKTAAYVAQHPDAIVNPAEAEHAAYKAKDLEESVNSLGKVITHVIMGGSGNAWGKQLVRRDRAFHGDEMTTSEAIESLEGQRRRADENIEKGRQEYRDIIKVNDLMKGVSTPEQVTDQSTDEVDRAA